MTLQIEMEYEKGLDFDYEALAKKVVEAALDSENCPYEAEVNLLLTSDDQPGISEHRPGDGCAVLSYAGLSGSW